MLVLDDSTQYACTFSPLEGATGLCRNIVNGLQGRRVEIGWYPLNGRFGTERMVARVIDEATGIEVYDVQKHRHVMQVASDDGFGRFVAWWIGPFIALVALYLAIFGFSRAPVREF